MTVEISKYKDDPVLYAEEVHGYKLFEYQKMILREFNKAKQQNVELVISYPYRNGRTMLRKVWDEFKKLQ